MVLAVTGRATQAALMAAAQRIRDELERRALP